jgi:WD40 repeat protein
MKWLGLLSTIAIFSALLCGCQLAERVPARVIDVGGSAGRVVAFNPDASLIAVATLNGAVGIWSLDTGKRRAIWRAHRGTANGIVFLHNDRLLTAGYDGRVAIWTLLGILVKEWSADSPVTAFAAALPAGLGLSGHSDGWVRLWHLEGGLVRTWPIGKDEVRAVAITSDGRALAASDEDGGVTLWSPETQPKRVPRPPTVARSLVFSPAGDSLIGTGWFKLFSWQLPGGKLRVLPTAHRGIINSARFLPDGLLATISRQTDSSVLILDPISGVTVELLGRHDLCGTAVAVSRDGRYVASISDDATLRIWRIFNPAAVWSGPGAVRQAPPAGKPPRVKRY